jgi:hypothetical protein
MKKITKLAIVVGLLLQVFGHPVENKEVGWDFCGPPGGHPFIFTGYKFGWPAPFIRVGELWGCLTTPHRDVYLDWWGLFLTCVAWLAWLSIIDQFWPEVTTI